MAMKLTWLKWNTSVVVLTFFVDIYQFLVLGLDNGPSEGTKCKQEFKHNMMNWDNPFRQSERNKMTT
jgi:hypothetical protein